MDNNILNKLRDAESTIQKTADWYVSQVNQLNKEISRINSLPPEEVDIEKVEELSRQKSYLDNKATYELKQLTKFQEQKDKLLISNLRLAITGAPNV